MLAILAYHHANGAGYALALDGEPIEWFRTLAEAFAAVELLRRAHPTVSVRHCTDTEPTK